MIGLCQRYVSYTNMYELTELYPKQNSVWAKHPRIYQASWVGSALSCHGDSTRGYQSLYILLLSFSPQLLT